MSEQKKEQAKKQRAKREYYAIPQTAFESAIKLGVNNTKQALQAAKSLEPMVYVLCQKIVAFEASSEVITRATVIIK